MAELDGGREALRHIDAALAARPKRDGDALTAAVQRLAAFRDAYAARYRRDGAALWRGPLERINAVVSVTMAVAYPIGEVPWGELAKARDWLDALLAEEAGQSPRRDTA